MSSAAQETFKVWAEDNIVYGPIALPILIRWVQENRVFPETWVHVLSENRWLPARDLEALRPHFAAAPAAAPSASQPAGPGHVMSPELRQFQVFAGLADHELDQFASFGEVREVEPDGMIIRQGDPCDAVYFILAGTLRVRLLIGVDREDTTLCRISAGEFFGEVGMFLQSTRTADVIAETPTRLLRVTANAFQLLAKETPELAAPILYAIAGTMARRIADDNQRFYREATSQFLWR